MSQRVRYACLVVSERERVGEVGWLVAVCASEGRRQYGDAHHRARRHSLPRSIDIVTIQHAAHAPGIDLAHTINPLLRFMAGCIVASIIVIVIVVIVILVAGGVVGHESMVGVASELLVVAAASITIFMAAGAVLTQLVVLAGGGIGLAIARLECSRPARVAAVRTRARTHTHSAASVPCTYHKP